MRIAVPYENGNVFQHFGHTAHFAVYDVQDNQVAAKVVLPTMGSGHGALAGFLKTAHVDILICGGIGGGAQEALRQAGIKLYGGVQGSADEAVEALLAGRLAFDPDVHCDHHSHEHGDHDCGSHDCSDHHCGGHCGHH
ncbi:MAG: dinitrogenase iron-molybdenum cofactor biosynthesis protein [Clostridia bacterium]|nr:dinitrogenase iron-molybdenum cofactor biosynthesis protein [Clostridia bacterium]